MIKKILTIFSIIISIINLSLQHSYADDRLIVGAKIFTEGIIIAELANLSLQQEGIPTAPVRALGATRVLFDALEKGLIDIYPEYTGTLFNEIISSDITDNYKIDDVKNWLAERGLGMTSSLGFENTYRIGLLSDSDNSCLKKISKLSELKQCQDLTVGMTAEFFERQDGWQALKLAYNIPDYNVNILDHEFTYRALANKNVDIIDVYTTDAEIPLYNIKTLSDDFGFFPDYQAIYLYRLDIEKRFPGSVDVLQSLESTISVSDMQLMNKMVLLDGATESSVAANYLKSNLSRNIDNINISDKLLINDLVNRTKEHLFLVLTALALGIVISIPAGMCAFYFNKLGRIILTITEILQTIPALALLVFMLPLFGIGTLPAIAALFLYSLLPMVRGTLLGFQQIPYSLRESSQAMGLKFSTQLFKIDIPLAMPAILSGIRTSTVLLIGFATLGAIIGAGGYGVPILRGIRLNNIGDIMQGAVPAAVMALLAQGLLTVLERAVIPKGLR